MWFPQDPEAHPKAWAPSGSLFWPETRTPYSCLFHVSWRETILQLLSLSFNVRDNSVSVRSRTRTVVSHKAKNLKKLKPKKKKKPWYEARPGYFSYKANVGFRGGKGYLLATGYWSRYYTRDKRLHLAGPPLITRYFCQQALGRGLKTRELGEERQTEVVEKRPALDFYFVAFLAAFSALSLLFCIAKIAHTPYLNAPTLFLRALLLSLSRALHRTFLMSSLLFFPKLLLSPFFT